VPGVNKGEQATHCVTIQTKRIQWLVLAHHLGTSFVHESQFEASGCRFTFRTVLGGYVFAILVGGEVAHNLSL